MSHPTKKGQHVLALLAKWEANGEGTLNEGNAIDELWPILTQPRKVCDALERRGFLVYGDWNDECGYDLHLTNAGRAYIADPLRVACPVCSAPTGRECSHADDARRLVAARRP